VADVSLDAAESELDDVLAVSGQVDPECGVCAVYGYGEEENVLVYVSE
jgi:hypothetical protein